MASFTQIVAANGGVLLFTSKQDDVTRLLGGPLITNYEGVCLALVMMWFAKGTSKKDPAKGTENRAKAMNLQNEMEATWEGFATVESKAKQIISGKQFWYRSDQKQTFTSGKFGAEIFLQHDPGSERDSMNIFCIYFAKEPAHAIGVWRFAIPSGTMVLYDPNHGAGVVGKDKFRAFLNAFLTELYSDTQGYAVCAFLSQANS